MTPEQARWVIAFFQNLPRGENLIDVPATHEDPQLATHDTDPVFGTHDTGTDFAMHDYPQLY